MQQINIFIKKTIGVTLISIIAFSTTIFGSVAHAQFDITEEQIVELVRPTSVRVVLHVSGDIIIPSFEIDIANLSVKKSIDIQEGSTVAIDKYITGVGVFVSENGSIVTNAHIVSGNTFKLSTIGPIVTEAIYAEIEKHKNDIVLDSNDILTLGQEAVTYMVNNSTFNLEKEITVLNPNENIADDSGLTLKDRIDSGFPAQVIYVNDDFALNSVDVAIIKISEENTPAIKITKSNVESDEDIYLISYVSPDDEGLDGFFEPVLTKGYIEEGPEDDDSFFIKINVLDGLVSGPVISSSGELVGFSVIDANSPQSNNKVLSSDKISDLLSDEKVTAIPGDFYVNFTAALEKIEKYKCDDADVLLRRAYSLPGVFIQDFDFDGLVAE